MFLLIETKLHEFSKFVLIVLVHVVIEQPLTLSKSFFYDKRKDRHFHHNCKNVQLPPVCNYLCANSTHYFAQEDTSWWLFFATIYAPISILQYAKWHDKGVDINYQLLTKKLLGPRQIWHKNIIITLQHYVGYLNFISTFTL